MKEKKVNAIQKAAESESLIAQAIATAAPRPFVEKYKTVYGVAKFSTFVFGGISLASAGGGFYAVLSQTQNAYLAAAAAVGLAGVLELFKSATITPTALHFAGGEKTNGVIIGAALFFSTVSPLTSFFGAGEILSESAPPPAAAAQVSESRLLIESKTALLKNGDPKSGRTKTALQNLDAQIKSAEEKEKAAAAAAEKQAENEKAAAAEKSAKLQIWVLSIVALSEVLYIVSFYFVNWYSVRVARAHAPELFQDDDTPPPAPTPTPTRRETAPTETTQAPAAPTATPPNGGHAAPVDTAAEIDKLKRLYSTVYSNMQRAKNLSTVNENQKTLSEIQARIIHLGGTPPKLRA